VSGQEEYFASCIRCLSLGHPDGGIPKLPLEVGGPQFLLGHDLAGDQWWIHAKIVVSLVGLVGLMVLLVEAASVRLWQISLVAPQGLPDGEGGGDL
jgi:hypothetical protein